MTWIDPPPGPFAQGIGDDPRLRMDPYLLWADATGFAHTAFASVRSRGTPERVPVLLELAPGVDAAALRGADKAQAGNGVPSSIDLMPDSYGAGDRFLTAWVRPSFVPRIAPGGDLQNLVVRLELGMPNVFPGQTAATRPPPTSSTKTLIGVIDDGCPFAHAALRRPGGGARSTRILSLWDQEPDPAKAAFGPGAAPSAFAYGREVRRAELDALIKAATVGGRLDEDSCYEAAHYRGLRRAVTHGAHMLDLLAGPVPPASRVWRRADRKDGLPRQPSWQRRAPTEPESDHDIVFVQFPRDAIDDATGGWLCVHVLDAVRHILSCRSAPTQPVVINLSYGSQVGPHDGTSTLECALQDLCERNPGLEIVLPAGNSFSLQAHAGGIVSPPKGNSAKSRQFPGVRWSVPAGCEEASFVELWMPPASGVGVRLVPPGVGATPSPTVRAGECKVWSNGAQPAVGIFHFADPACGTKGEMVLLAMAPTAAHAPDATVASAGYWRIELDCDNATPPRVDAYIARNDPNIGARRLGRTGRFIDAGYDPGAYLRRADDDPPGADAPPNVVQRRGTLNWIATTSPEPSSPPKIQVVAGRVLNVQVQGGARAQFHPRYSSAGPSRDGLVDGPQSSFISDESLTLRGLRAAGTRSGSTVRIVGTSTAVPQAVRLRVRGDYGKYHPKEPPTYLPLSEETLQGAGAFDPPTE